MARVCDVIFAVILVFFLTEGTSSNGGKASHWLLVLVRIFTGRRGVILAGRMARNHIFDLKETKMVNTFVFPRN